MPFSAAMLGGLKCPRCPDGQLALTGATLTCVRCANHYPFIGNIPCLMEDPAHWCSLWLSRLAEFLSLTEGLMNGWATEANLPHLSHHTRARIERVIDGTKLQRHRVESLFGDFAGGTPQIIPTRPEPGDSPILSCYENIFRDWAWGEAESELSRALVARLVPETLGRLAVYGAGAGRLAVDVHQTLQPTETFALDTNPLPLLVAEKLVRGETLDLPEFPVAPHAGGEVVVTQHLRCPFKIRDGFTFLFADARRPPFGPGSLDAVLTSWFVDVVNADPRDTAAAINRVLRPGGVWINIGPLRFKSELSRQYAIEEVWEIVEGNGFDMLARERGEIPYFDSPISGFRRIETVFCFTARKSGEAVSAPLPVSVPPWIADPNLPIPMSPAMLALGRKSMFTAGAISLVDGVRSMSGLASEIGRATGVDPTVLLDQLRAFFSKIPSD